MVQSNSGKLYKLVDPKRYGHVAHFSLFCAMFRAKRRCIFFRSDLEDRGRKTGDGFRCEGRELGCLGLTVETGAADGS